MNWYKKAQMVYHNTRSEFLPTIAKEGLLAGTFTYKPYPFTGENVWIATEKDNLKNTQEHQYGTDIAIESQWEDDDGNQFNVIPPEKLYLVGKRGKIKTRMDQYQKWNTNNKKFKYFGQCNEVRCDKTEENNWQNMIKKHKKVFKEEFEKNCDINVILDEDETLNEFITADPSSYFAKSFWGDKKCYYLMTHGFEFIFLEKIT